MDKHVDKDGIIMTPTDLYDGPGLDDHHTIVAKRPLAVAIGLNEALFVQQLHYWLRTNSPRHVHPDDQGVYRIWIYNTMHTWTDDTNFPFWSEKTIQRIIEKLAKLKLIISGNFNKINIDRTKWYSIDYEVYRRFYEAGLAHLAEIRDRRATSAAKHYRNRATTRYSGTQPNLFGFGISVSSDLDKMTKSADGSSDLDNLSCPFGQNDQMHLDNLTRPIPENTYKDKHTETTNTPLTPQRGDRVACAKEVASLLPDSHETAEQPKGMDRSPRRSEQPPSSKALPDSSKSRKSSRRRSTGRRAIVMPPPTEEELEVVKEIWGHWVALKITTVVPGSEKYYGNHIRKALEVWDKETIKQSMSNYGSVIHDRQCYSRRAMLLDAFLNPKVAGGIMEFCPDVFYREKFLKAYVDSNDRVSTPSVNALSYAENLAGKHNIVVPDEVRASKVACSAFIADLKNKKIPDLVDDGEGNYYEVDYIVRRWGCSSKTASVWARSETEWRRREGLTPGDPHGDPRTAATDGGDAVEVQAEAVEPQDDIGDCCSGAFRPGMHCGASVFPGGMYA